MPDQQSLPMPEPVSEKPAQPNMVPYERFAEVNRQLKELRAQMAEINPTEPGGQAGNDTQQPSVEDVYRQMVENPEAYLSGMMSQVVQQEIALLRDEMELKSALKAARVQYPEFKDFEQYVLQEIMGLVQEDPEMEKLTWDDILGKGIERLQSRLKSAMQKAPPGLSTQEPTAANGVQQAFMEGNASRKLQPLMPSFTRDQIAKMSLQEFLQHEAAINEAMKNNQIR